MTDYAARALHQEGMQFNVKVETTDAWSHAYAEMNPDFWQEIARAVQHVIDAEMLRVRRAQPVVAEDEEYARYRVCGA